MKLNQCRIASALVLVVVGAWTTVAFACATCGCALSTDAAMGFCFRAGPRLSASATPSNGDA
jgi:hypothetical protein